MSGPVSEGGRTVREDKSWTIAPTLGWFCGALAAGLLVIDGDVGALADRLTTPRGSEGAVATAGPVFTAKPVVVAEAPSDDRDERAAALPVADTGERSRVGPLEDVCLEGPPVACKRWGMDGFYAAIARTREGKLGRALRVSWYGDSVVATDAIPARLRARLQTELGDGGPGFVFAAQPHRFCHHEGIVRTLTGTWQPYAISTTTVGDGMYGAGGSSAETHGGRSAMKLVAGKASHVELYYLAAPRGGTAVITADKAEVLRTATARDSKGGAIATATVPAGASRFELIAEGKVRVFGVALENPRGAVVDNFGIVSVTAKNFAARDAAHFSTELGRRNSDLVMVMIGANEAAWLAPGDKDTKEYQARYERALAPIRKGRPDGACVVVSPLDQAEAKDDAYPSRPVMPLLVDAQRKAAHAQGCAFYSTYDWMGGKGSAAKWFKKGLVGSDFQHLTKKGANKMADGVFETLMAGAARYGKR